MAEKEQYIGKSLIKGSPKGPLRFKIGPKAVKPENLQMTVLTQTRYLTVQ